MSVIQVLEQYEKKHDSPDDDKAGWKRLIHGAVSKAAGLLWSTGGSVEVTLGPDAKPHTDNTNFFEFRSPITENYFSESIESESELFLSFENRDDSTIATSPKDKNSTTPKFHSTPYKTKGVADYSTSFQKMAEKKSPERSPSRPEKIETTEDSKTNKAEINNAKAHDMSDLCSEMERLSLKKMITEVEKSIAVEVRQEFDKERRKMDEHDKKVAELLEREREEKEMENQLKEMNWLQKMRESQDKVENDFNVKLEAIVAKTRRKEVEKRSIHPSTSSVTVGQISSSDHKTLETDLVAKKKALIESIGDIQKTYNSKYNDIIHLLQSSRVSLVTEFHAEFETLKRNNIQLTDIISKSKCGNLTEEDVEECAQLLVSLEALYNKIKDRNKEYEETKRMEDEANAKLMEAMKKNQENAKSISGVTETELTEKEEVENDSLTAATDECSRRRLDRLKYYRYVTKVLKKTEELLEPFLNDDKYKQFRKDCQRAINVPVNAISPTNSYHLMDKLDKLTNLLDGKSVPIINRRFSATFHPYGVKYCLVLLARKIVKAGEDVVSSHPETGHAIASVVVALIIKYPVLTVYLHAYFFRICPYLVPLDLKPSLNESDEDFNRRLGFNYEGSECEETDKFLKRMSGVAQLYGAILVANKRKNDFSQHPPLGVSELWMWLTNFITIEPHPDISATILLDILEVSGHFLLTSYGFNFQKLLYLICTDYLTKINKITPKGRGGPVERLKTFLEDVIQVKRIPPPKGLLSANFW